ncbi:outer membrane autotransporter barrel domain-containing protein [Lysobacter sp. yr284]|uniref:putative Ig domain-containing protein n=1 Tax=Lysobacter sp. yr284 TaxID=1761791 RepID=UPI000896FABE|nr:putative Ig domain-containing protein [Lysobacter sp. yr284]SDY91237.1 outer membrane autotransporter barrel domain-containing protein [Lysobacter sp. yr284]
MQQQSAQSAGVSHVSYWGHSAAARTWRRGLAAILIVLAGLWSFGAVAAPSVLCPVKTLAVANGGTAVLDADLCDGGPPPGGFGIGTLITPPQHGNVTVNQSTDKVTYTHNGDTALTDVFTFGDGVGGEVTVNVTISAATSPITVTPASIAPQLGVSYSQSLSATGGVAPYTFTFSAGTLPTGLSFANGTFSGTVRQRGNFPVQISVTDSTAPTPLTTVKSYTIAIPNNQHDFTPAALPTLYRTASYNIALAGSGGVAPYNYAIETGALPAGLSISGGAIVGTPTASGAYTVTIKSTDSSLPGPGVPAVAFRIRTYTGTVLEPPTVVVNPVTIPGATVGAAYNQAFTASGGTAPYAFAVSAGALPAGLTLDTAGALTGTPTAAGTFNFTVRATDANNFPGTRAYTLVVAPPVISIAPPTLPNGLVAASYTQTLSASGGVGPYTFAVTAGALPAGLTLAANGAISGTPTAGGTFNFTATATGTSTGTGAPHTGSRAYALVIAPPTVNLPATSLANATQAVAYTATLNPASQGTAPYKYAVTAGALPPGLSLNINTGVISGTPSASGTFNFAVTATDSSTGSGPYNSAPRGYVLQVVNIPPVANAVSASVAYNSGANPITLNITGGVATSVAIGTAPLHGTAIASGVTVTYQPNPGYAGPDSFTYTATNSAGTSAPATATISVGNPTITVTASGPFTAQIGVAYTQTFTWNGGAQPFTGFQVTGLPAGLSVTATSANTATVSGTPSAAGSFALNASATDASTGNGPFTVGQGFTLSVSAPTLTLSPAAGTLTAVYGTAYSQTYVAGGGTAPYNYAISAGALPTGLSLDPATGVLAGTPTVTGLYTFSVRARDSSTGAGAPFARTQNYVMQVQAPTIVVSPVSFAAAQVGAAYSATATASGGIGPYTFAIPAGSAPPGLTMSSTGTLSGTPTAGGTFNFMVIATDANGQTGNRAYIFSVAVPTIAIAPVTLPNGGVAQPYSQTLSASGGTAGYSFAVTAGSLPAGLSLSNGGVISGTPTAGGAFNFTVTATDSSTGSGPYTGSRAYTLTIGASTILLPATPLANATVASAYSAALNPATGGTAPYSYAISAGALPAGMNFNGTTRVVSGTPSAPGTFNFSVVATDSSGGTGPYSSAPQSYTLTVADIVPVANAVSVNVGYNAAATPVTLNITGGIAASVAIAAAPAHGTAIATGTSITYQPNAGFSGPDSFTYTATNVAGTSAPATVTVNVADPTITIAASGPLTGQVGTAYTQTFTWSGGAAPYNNFNAAGLPAGLSITATGTDSMTVSGTPTASGTFNATVSARDSGTGHGPFTVGQVFAFIIGAPTLSMTPAPGNLPMNYGTASSINFAASGGTAPYSFNLVAGSLPVGVSLTSAGVLSGTPTVPGNYNVTVRAQDSSTGTGAPFRIDQSYTIVVAVPSIAIDPASIPNGTAAVAYNQNFSATGGVAPYTFALTAGALPVGMSLTSAGELSGIPRSDGNFSLTVQATDANGQTASKVYTFAIAPATLTISPATLPGGVVGTAYNQGLSTSGGIAPYTYALASGSLPVGIALSPAGVVSGTPTTAGSYNFAIRSTDDAGYNTTLSYTVVVADAVPVAVDDSASTQSNQAVTINVIANDTGIIASVAVASAPTHGTATPSGTTVVYTPASNYFGSDSFTYTATGPGGTSAPATVTVTVNALPVPVGQPQNATTLSTQPVTIDAATGATGAPFTGVTLLAPPSSGTATVQGTQIVYTPAAETVGAIALTYTLNNPFGASAPITSTITVNPVPVATPKRVRTIAGATVKVELTQDARGGPFTGAALVSLTPAGSGTATVSAANGGYTLSYTPVIGYSGLTVATFTLSNAYATSAPATVEIEVAPRSDPSKDAEVLGILNAQAEAARRFANAQIGNFQKRMEGLHDGGTGGSRFDNGLSFSVDPRCREGARRTPGSDCREPALGDEQAGVDAKPRVEGTGPQYGVWTGGTIESGNRDGRGGGSGGLDFKTSGVSLGADYRVRRDFAFGGGVGYGRDDTDVGTRGSRSKGESYSAVLYASYHPGESFFLDGLLGYQWLSFDSRRFVTDTGGMVRGSRDGSQWFASVSTGLEYQRDKLRISPYARLDVARATLDGYTESGDAQYALNYRDLDVDTTTTSLGLRLDYRHPVRWGTFSPQLRLEYQHDFQDASYAIMSYADMVGGPFYRARLQGLDRNRFVFGLGAVLQTERDWALRLEYRGLFGSGNDDDNSFMINIEKKY